MKILLDNNSNFYIIELELYVVPSWSCTLLVKNEIASAD